MGTCPTKLDNVLNSIPQQLASNLGDSFQEIENSFFMGKHKLLGLDAGHFVESVRRLIEFKLFGHFTPFNQKLDFFNEATLKRYERVQEKNLTGY